MNECRFETGARRRSAGITARQRNRKAKGARASARFNVHEAEDARATGDWQLLTTLPVTTLAEACASIGWYALRWQIEVIRKVLKSGCQIEQRQLETAARLERVLAVDLGVAWRLLALCKAAREQPDAAVSAWLSQAEWEALWCHVHQRTTPPKTPPSVRSAVRWIAQLGGFLARKSDGEPGPVTLWRGLHRLNDLTAMWRLCHGKKRRQKCAQ